MQSRRCLAFPHQHHRALKDLNRKHYAQRGSVKYVWDRSDDAEFDNVRFVRRQQQSTDEDWHEMNEPARAKKHEQTNKPTIGEPIETEAIKIARMQATALVLFSWMRMTEVTKRLIVIGDWCALGLARLGTAYSLFVRSMALDGWIYGCGDCVVSIHTFHTCQIPNTIWQRKKEIYQWFGDALCSNAWCQTFIVEINLNALVIK